jgi:hypothetical protein
LTITPRCSRQPVPSSIAKLPRSASPSWSAWCACASVRPVWRPIQRLPPFHIVTRPMPTIGRARAGGAAGEVFVERVMAGMRHPRLAASFKSNEDRVHRISFHGPAGFDRPGKETR